MGATGIPYACAILDNFTLKCWSYLPFDLGFAYSGMGNSLPAVNLGPARTAQQVASGADFMCVLLDTNEVKCWGSNTHGQVGHGALGEGEIPPVLDVGTGRHALMLSAGLQHTCALLDDRRVKCWGDNQYGQLGIGDTMDRGTSAAQLGDDLPAVDLTF